jgi:GxxExxY protein
MDMESRKAQRITEGTEFLEFGSLSVPPKHIHWELTDRIIGAAIEVHRELRSGFLEKVYENALSLELRSRGLQFAPQQPLPVKYKGQLVGTYVADLVVEGVVLCEIKAMEALSPIHDQQVLHYLKATGIKLGLLLNFGASKLQIKRLIV